MIALLSFVSSDCDGNLTTRKRRLAPNTYAVSALYFVESRSCASAVQCAYYGSRLTLSPASHNEKRKGRGWRYETRSFLKSQPPLALI